MKNVLLVLSATILGAIAAISGIACLFLIITQELSGCTTPPWRVHVDTSLIDKLFGGPGATPGTFGRSIVFFISAGVALGAGSALSWILSRLSDADREEAGTEED
jgi:hypothetical protein